MTKRQIRKQARARNRKKVEFQNNLYWIINAYIDYAMTGWWWFFGRKKFNAILVGQRELESLKEMPYVYSKGTLRYNVPKFFSYVCPEKEIQVLPVNIWTYLKVINIAV